MKAYDAVQWFLLGVGGAAMVALVLLMIGSVLVEAGYLAVGAIFAVFAYGGKFLLSGSLIFLGIKMLVSAIKG